MKSRDASVERENLGSAKEFPRPPFYAFHKEVVIALPSRQFFFLQV